MLDNSSAALHACEISSKANFTLKTYNNNHKVVGAVINDALLVG